VSIDVSVLETVSAGDLDAALGADGFQRNKDAGVAVVGVVGAGRTGELSERLPLQLEEIEGGGAVGDGFSDEGPTFHLEDPFDPWSSRDTSDDRQHLVDTDADLEVLALLAHVEIGHVEGGQPVSCWVGAQACQAFGGLGPRSGDGQSDHEGGKNRDELAHRADVRHHRTHPFREGICGERSYARR